MKTEFSIIISILLSISSAFGQTIETEPAPYPHRNVLFCAYDNQSLKLDIGSLLFPDVFELDQKTGRYRLGFNSKLDLVIKPFDLFFRKRDLDQAFEVHSRATRQQAVGGTPSGAWVPRGTSPGKAEIEGGTVEAVPRDAKGNASLPTNQGEPDAGAAQPAAASKSKPEGKENFKPESEIRPR